MPAQPPETIAAFFVMLTISVLPLLVIFGFRRTWPWASRAAPTLVAQWKPALIIAALFALGNSLSGKPFNPVGIALSSSMIFGQAWMGMALARSLPGFEPLPVTQAFVRRERVWRETGLMAALALALVPIVFAAGSLGMIIGDIFGETVRSSEAAALLPSNPAQLFLALLAGAGLAEQTIFRLFLLSLLWRLTGHRRLAIVVSAAAFGAYHLSPINGMYLVFWQYPVSQFLSSTFTGLVWGYVFTRRGLETNVFAHTLGDFISIMLFTG